MEEVIIREAVLEDAEGIARVHVRSRQTAYAGLLPDEGLKKLDKNFDQRVKDWCKDISDPKKNMAVFVAVMRGKVVGFASGEKERTGKMPYDGFLSKLHVLKLHQKQGIGRRLVSAVAQALLARGMRSMMVRVFKENPNRAFYEALGGVYLGEVDNEIWGEVYQLSGYGWDNLEDLVLVD